MVNNVYGTFNARVNQDTSPIKPFRFQAPVPVQLAGTAGRQAGRRAGRRAGKQQSAAAPVPFCPGLPWPVLSCPVLSCPVLSCLALPCLALPCHGVLPNFQLPSMHACRCHDFRKTHKMPRTITYYLTLRITTVIPYLTQSFTLPCRGLRLLAIMASI